MSNSDMACKDLNCTHKKCIEQREESARDKALREAKCGDSLGWIKSVCCGVGVKKWLVGFECPKCKRKDVKVLF